MSEAPAPGPATARATCALHFDVPSAATCARCGRFMCESCRFPSAPTLCTACGPLVADPYGLAGKGFDLMTPLLVAARLVAADWWKLLVVVVAFALPAAALQLALVREGDDLKSTLSSVRITSFYDGLVGIIGVQAMLALFIARSEGRALSLGAALGEGVAVWGRTLLTRIRSSLWILLFVLVLVVPGVWKATTLAFAQIAALRSQQGDALETSEGLVSGRFWNVLGFLVVMFVALYLPMMVALFVVGLGLELTSAPRFLAEALTTIISAAFVDVAMTAVMYVAYVQLHHTAGTPLEPMRWRVEPPLAK